MLASVILIKRYFGKLEKEKKHKRGHHGADVQMLQHMPDQSFRYIINELIKNKKVGGGG
jgi:hypothetical protein